MGLSEELTELTYLRDHESARPFWRSALVIPASENHKIRQFSPGSRDAWPSRPAGRAC